MKLICHGCGASPPKDEPYPFRCPNADSGDDADHVLKIELETEGDVFPRTGDLNPFVRYRELLYSWRIAIARGMSDDEYVALVNDLDERVAAVDGAGFELTPFSERPELAADLGADALYVKNETENVSGTHKARHLMGIALYLEVAERTGLVPEGDKPRLAISSCGNAALAAAVVASALGRALDVYVPDWADENVLERLKQLGANIIVCKRKKNTQGDPCTLAFRKAVKAGALPFTCQGSENGLAIDGGRTLGWELVSQESGKFDQLFLQIGGGALASSVIQALRIAHSMAAIDSIPRIHAVQTEGGHPLERSWQRVLWEFDKRMSRGGNPSPDGAGDAQLGTWLFENRDSAEGRGALRHAALNRREFMWPWEEPPQSEATGILDDETYDWYEIVHGMIDSSGWPVVVTEAQIRQAHVVARTRTGIDVDATGTAGLAGALQLGEATASRVAVLFTGVTRR